MESSNGNRKSFLNNKRKSNIPQPSSSKKSFLTPATNASALKRGSLETPSSSRLSSYGRFPRKSTCTTPADRSSSIGLKKKDPRQLENKTNMKKSINNLFQFLVEQGYSNENQHTFSPQIMNPPTNKLFLSIFTFLARFIDEEFKIIGKPEECLHNFLNCQGYPFMINKSHLHNVGTLSSWPHALGTLDWLMKLIKINLNYVNNSNFPFKLSEEDSCLEIQHSYFKECYMKYMNGDDGPYEEAFAKAEEQINEKDKDLIKEVDAAADRLKAAKEEKAKLLKQKKKIELSISSKNETDKNIKDMDKYILEMKEYLPKKENMVCEKLKRLNDLKTQIKCQEKKLQSVKSTVSFQKYSCDDVKRISKEVKEFSEKIQEVENEIGNIDEENYRYNSKNQKLQEMIKTFYSNINELIENFFEKFAAIDFNVENHKIEDYLVKMEADVKTNLKTISKFMVLFDEANLFYIKRSDQVLKETQEEQKQLHESSSKVIQHQIEISKMEVLKKEQIDKNEEEKKKLDLANQATKELTQKIKLKEEEIKRCLEDGKIKCQSAEVELKELKKENERIAAENKQEIEESLIRCQKIANEKLAKIKQMESEFSEKLSQEKQKLENDIKETKKKQEELDAIDLEGAEKELKELIKKTKACQLNDEEKELLDYIANIKTDEENIS